MPAYHCSLVIWNLVIKSIHLLGLYTSDGHEEGINIVVGVARVKLVFPARATNGILMALNCGSPHP